MNPLFGEKNDAKVYQLASELRIPEPLGWDKWEASLGAQWARNDADIDFNQSELFMFAVGIGRHF